MNEFNQLLFIETGLNINWEDKDYFQIERFKRYSDVLYNLSIENELQTLPLMKEVLEIVRLINNKKIILKDTTSQEFQEYFDKEYIFNVAKYLIINRTFKNQILLDFSNAILIQCMQYFINNIDKQNLKLVEMLKYLLDPQRAYFKINDQDLTNSYLPTLVNHQDLINNHQEFISGLQKGDMVDSIKVDYNYKKCIWARATVVKIKQNMINVQFENQTEKWIDSKQILEIQPYKSQVSDEEYNWRMNLEEGMEIDELDTENLWYNSTVIGVRNLHGMEGKEVFVGLRVYRENGDKVDTNSNLKFFGWSSKYDEWLSVFSPRIQRLNTMAKTQEALIYQMQTNEEIIDDSNDLLISSSFHQNNSNIYVVSRSQFMQQKSLFLLYLADMFGQQQGYQIILNQIRDKKTPLEILALYIQILSSISVMFFKPFADKYIKEVNIAVYDFVFKNNTENNIRQLNKDKLDNIYTALGDMLKRIHPVGIKNNLIEEYQLQLSLLCFKSEILEKQLQGLKQICEILKNARQQVHNNSNNKKLNTLKQQQWITDNKIFDLLFNVNQHDLLVKKAGDLIKFMVQEGILNENHLEKIWQCTQKGSTELKLTVFKLLNEISVFLKSDQQFFFLDKIKNCTVSQLTVNEIELIHELTPFYQQNQEYCQKASEILFELLGQSPKKELVTVIINRIGDLLKNWDMKSLRQDYLIKCLNKMEKNENVLISLKLMIRLLDIYPTMISSLEDQSRSSILQNLNSNYNLFQSVLTQFNSFKQSLQSFQHSIKSIDSHLSTLEDETYLSHIKTRFTFFEYIVFNQSSFNQILGLNQLQQLWELSYNNSFIQEEKQSLYTLFNKLMQYSNNNNQEQLIDFFQNYMCKDYDYDYQGFQILKQVFCLVNQQQYKLQKINNSTQNGFQYKSKVLPSQMIQMEFIWKLCLQTKDQQVSQEVTMFITHLYLNQIDSDSKANFINEFLNLAFDKIKSNPDSNNHQLNTNIIQLISEFLDESEVNGIGNLKPHCSLNKGQLIQIMVINNANQGLDMQSKIKVKIYSNQNLYELKQKIALQLQLTIDQLELMRQSDSRMLSDKYNGRSINELKIKNQEQVIASKRMTQEIDKVDLIVDGQMCSKLKQVVDNWFGMYNTNGKMSMDQCAAFINSCTGDNCKGSETRLKLLYDEWDKDQDGYLTLSDFHDFYLKSSLEKPSVVWANLQAYHYRNDLRLPSEVQQESINPEQLPRWVISNNPEFTGVLFRLLDIAEMSGQVWSLISRLPTSPYMITHGLSNQSSSIMTQDQSPSTLLQLDNKYKLMYHLYSIDYNTIFLNPHNFIQLINLLSKNDSKDNQIYTLILDILTNALLYVLDNKNLKVLQMSSQIQIDVPLTNIDTILIPPNIYQNQLYQFNQLNPNQKLRKDSSNSDSFNNKDQNINYYSNKKSSVSSKDSFQYNEKNNSQDFSQQNKIIIEDISGINHSDDISNQNAQPIPREPNNNLNKNQIEEKQQKTVRKISQSHIQRKELDVNLVNDILQNLNLKEYQQLLLEKLEQIIVKSFDQELEIEERIIVQVIMTQLVGLSVYDEELLKEQGNYIKIVVKGLFTKENIRKYIQNYIYIIQLYQYYNFQNKNELSKVIQLLFELFPQESQHVNEYFDLLCKLIEQNAQDQQLEMQINFIVQKLIKHQSNDCKQKQDKILVGELRLLEKLVNQNISKDFKSNDRSQELVEQIFSKCLFNLEQPVKCKSKEARESGYRLLQVLAQKNEENIQYLLKELKLLIENVPMIQGYNYRGGQSQSRSQYNYSGIRNLGCICYMIAMLQQFYMTKAFRYSLLMADDFNPPNITNVTNKDHSIRQVDDNCLHQLQKMFSFLEITDRIDYNPIDFCQSFKDFSGQPVNVGIQQDAQEFLNMIFDKLEKALEKTAYKKILDGIYGGKTYTIIQCKSCNKKTLREEDFYNISLAVKNKNNLIESFEKYIEGEEISDYNCEGCKKKSDIIKRSCLSQLPNFLICHLQRIVFDMDSMQNEKINTKLEFPHELSLYPFTYKGLEEKDQEYQEQDFMYKLKGVVVHIGQAEFGHYYSYIESEGQQWLEFNDSNIVQFDKSKLDQECFGGVNSNQQKNDWGGWMKQGYENNKNAYILVYEKLTKKPLTLLRTDNEAEMQKIQQVLNINIDSESVQIGLDNFQQYIPSKLHEEVYKDNQQFMLEEHLYSEKFFKFVDSIIKQYKFPELTDEIRIKQFNEQVLEENQKQTLILIIDTLENLIYKILSRTHDNDMIVDYSRRLQHLMYFVPEYSLNIFKRLSNNPTTFELLLQCPDKQVRTQICQILVHTINILIAYYQLDLNVQGQQDEKQNGLIKFLDNLLDYMPIQLSKSWTKMGQYFEFWRDFSFSGEVQVNYLMERRFIQRGIDFFLEKYSPIYERETMSKRTQMGNRYQQPQFQALIKTIANLVVRCQYSNVEQKVNQETLMKNVKYYTFEPIDIKCLFTLEFYEKSLRENQDVQSLCQIIQHLGYENEKLCFVVSYALLKGIQQASTEDSKQYLLGFSQLLEIEDSLIFKKCEWLLGFPQFRARDNYGCYNMTNLDDFVYTYQSTLNLENTESLLDIMLYNKKRVEFQSILIINILIKLALKNNNIYQYLLYLQPPSYLNSIFHDWMIDFVNNYIQEQQKYFINDQNKLQTAQDTLILLKEYSKKIHHSIKQQTQYFQNLTADSVDKDNVDYVHHMKMREYMLCKDKSAEVVECLIPSFIIGKCIEDKVVKEEYFENNTLTLNYNDIHSFLVKSRPTLKTNLAFKESVVKDHYIFNSCVRNSEVESLFFKPKYFMNNNNIIASNMSSQNNQLNDNAIDNELNLEKKQFEFDRNKTEFKQSTDEGDTNMDYIVQQYIKKYVFSNNSQQYIIIQLSVKPQEGFTKFYNTKQLFSKMTFLVGPNSKGVIFNMHKMFPTLPWDQIQTNFDYVVLGKDKPNEFKAYLCLMGQDQSNYESSVSSEYKSEQKANYDAENVGYKIDQQDAFSYVVENGSDQNDHQEDYALYQGFMN